MKTVVIFYALGEQEMRKLYSFALDEEKCIFFVKVDGFFKEEDAKIYLSEFQTVVNSINPSIFTLIIDGRGQEEVPSDVVDDIIFVLKLYWMANFKTLIIISPTSPASRIQVENCAHKINFPGVFVDSVEEAYNLLNK
ncbi:hypothetical protein ACQRXC_25720 (plasmid) [Niallia taxi]|uniref:Uncharacterized protein n=1 Tax=Niallia taxi TaxID=2499688 RepID=A0A437K917_9BACI|nr:hypothetical protein [Niallia taxi]RVT60819.1 hypothetical protein EM808_16385 [Niallia taxi]